jgi:hypothetical protein
MNENKFKYAPKLKQHTPIIHFQSNESGATLRATELKPKFDRFLKKYVFNNEKEYKKFLIKDKEAFDYKVKIKPPKYSRKILYKTYLSTRERNQNDKRIGPYFGDFYGIEHSDVEIEFFSFNTELIKIIKENFEDFLIYESFGNRSNKGFGNYTLATTSKEKFEQSIRKYFILIKKEENEAPLKWILDNYQVLKSGKNRPYKKSKLMEHFLKRGIHWEKRWIKRVLKESYPDIFNDLKDEYHQDDFNFTQNETYSFVRCVLGMPKNYEFLLKSSKKDKLSVSVSCLNQNIEKFPSPIIFKVFENNIYVLLKKDIPINPIIFNQRFRFEAKYYNQTYDLGELLTPADFDIKKFLEGQL